MEKVVLKSLNFIEKCNQMMRQSKGKSGLASPSSILNALAPSRGGQAVKGE